MRTGQIAALAGAIGLIAILYWGANTVPPAKKGDNAPMAGGAAMGPNHVPASFDSLELAARKALPEHAAGELAAAEQQLNAIKDSAAMPGALEAIAKIWQEHKQLPVAAYYYAEAAKLENSEKKLNFAGQFFLDLMHQQGASPSVQLWEAQQAVAVLSRSLEINPDNDTATLALASGYIEGTGETMQGVQLLLGITRKRPDHIPANLILGRLAVQSGQFDKAIGRFETVLRQEPQNTEALYFMAEAYKGKGNKQKAIELFEQCKSIINNPDFSRDIDAYINTFK